MKPTVMLFQYLFVLPSAGEAIVIIILLAIIVFMLRKPKAILMPTPYADRDIPSEKLANLYVSKLVTIVDVPEDGIPIGQYSADFVYERDNHENAPCFKLDELAGTGINKGEYNVPELIEFVEALHR